MAEGHFQGTKGSPRGGPQRWTDTPAPRPVEEEGGNGKVFLKGCAGGLSKVCEEKVRREIEKERKREKESDNVCIWEAWSFCDNNYVSIYLFYLSLFIWICVMTCVCVCVYVRACLRARAVVRARERELC